MEAVVEFHGFKDNENKFVIKELAIVSKYFQTHLVFSAPYSKSNLNAKARKTVNWLANYFHFMKWNDEGIPYDEEWIRTLCSQFSTLYTRGEEKVGFLKLYHDNVLNILEPSSRSLAPKVTCIIPQHKGLGAKCAMRSAQAIYMYKFEHSV